MKCTDACVFPYPEGDSSFRRLALEAKPLGYDSIVCINAPLPEMVNGVRVIRGAILESTTMKDFRARVKKAAAHADLVIADAGDAKYTRAILASRGIHILRGIHLVHRKYFDHVAARTAAENGIALDIDLTPIIREKGIGRQRALHSYADLLELQRRFDFPLTISSNARSYLDLRSVRAFKSLCSLFGMEEDEVQRALGNVESLLSSRGTVEVIE